MLKELVIRHLAIIEEVHIQFSRGFHVLTGETGAGKSILIDALGLIAGGRASVDFVRHGKEKAEIEAVFELAESHPVRPLLEEWGFASDELDVLIIRREITSGGKSTCRVNGRVVTLALLKQIGSKLLDISGQHEHQSLLSAEEHLSLLDQFGGAEIIHLRSQYQSLYREFKEIDQELNRLKIDQQELAHRIDLLEFQREEIEGAGLVPGEDEELEQERNRLAHMEKLMQHTAKAYQALFGERGALELLQESLSHAEEMAEVDHSLKPAWDNMQSAYYQLEEAAREISRYGDGLEFDPERLYEVEERLHLIKQLKRKYGESIDEILAYGEKIKQELSSLNHREETEAELTARRNELQEELLALAKELTAKRKKAATLLETRVEKELADLNMGSTVFHVAFYRERAVQLLPHGQDLIEFQIAPNPGEPLKPLAKIASGGELSRIMLALKTIFASSDQSHTLIFDEIDTGVSGRAAQAIAEKMAALGRKHQVLSVTHLPQVACMADHHFCIAKEALDNETRTKVERLDLNRRIRELARMLGGAQVTHTTTEHAQEMIRLAEEVKQAMAEEKQMSRGQCL
ncbi:DNA repair protein RecN [Thermoactinomyces sp. CICC 10521]|uniref:DNA repair protein RecN n=1 Tax=Thermoactinomyces sp. CICC 10521 TaxID=2767426 RepID=UPI0018DB1AB1|nr:DNA repair protein RecN [Thermoactinomyces sp. CICC 10521]MBH8606660.1 DNA repair protein RecN [Thermoactinomyces sp. CICC 10521]